MSIKLIATINLEYSYYNTQKTFQPNSQKAFVTLKNFKEIEVNYSAIPLLTASKSASISAEGFLVRSETTTIATHATINAGSSS